ncbi:prolyl oligopeptidase family serine peptidase [Kineococcus sp. SYSU DK005]|uniref:prolyl oligopeptidase family serine peptidase n=1 Tax=Kineococcus sp. SYSU DK005 TaxID=3383126 RepID=UPI003D7E9492
MKRAVRVALAVTTGALLLAPCGAAAAAPSSWSPPGQSQPRVLGADVIAEVQPLGYFVTAVAVHYDRDVHLRGGEVPAEAFEVSASVQGSTSARTVTRAYLNDEPERAGRGDRSGDWVIVELSTEDANASASTYDGQLTHVLPLEGAYSIDQVADVRDERGRVVVPEGPAVVNDGVLSPDDAGFARGSYTGTSGQTLAYGLFSPQRDGRGGGRGPWADGRERGRPSGAGRVPLVVALHGAGERGTDGTVNLIANELAVSFTRPERQARNPSIVLAPQAPPPSVTPVPAGSSVWEVPSVQSALMELIERTVRENPVDPDRIYITGLSMGSMGTWDILPRHPDLFAAALPVTGYADLDSAPVVADIPIWATHSIDDASVLFDRADSDWHMMDAIEATGTPVVRDEWAGNLPDAENEARARAQWRRAQAVGSHTLFTAFTEGTTPVNPHFSWVPTYSNGVMLDWLFAQSKRSSGR